MARYTSKELEKMLDSINLDGISIYALSKQIHRSAYGVALEIRRLSKVAPEIWNPEKARGYTRKVIRKHKGNVREQQRRWHERHGEEYRSRRAKWREYVEENFDLEKLKDHLNGCAMEYYSKQEFADELKIHPSLLSHYLAGRRIPPKVFFRKLARLNRISFDSLQDYLRG